MKTRRALMSAAGCFAAASLFGCAHRLPVVGGVFGPVPTTIAGVVRHPLTGTPVVGASVMLEGATVNAVRTDSAGRFSFSRLARGVYDIGVRDSSLSELWIPAVSVGADTLHIVLEPHSNPPRLVGVRAPHPLMIIRSDPDSVFVSIAVPGAPPRMDVERVRSIEVIKGRRGLAYGASAAGGIIVVTMQAVTSSR